ncbi:ion transporter [Alphaproteobacteria bacterium]|nr:ion transporter [Alphaproteobacteria bacterium]
MLTKRRVYETLEKGRVGDRQSRYCDIFLSILIVVNLVAVCLETIDSLFAAYTPIFVAVELVSVSIFSIEYGLRVWSRPAAPNDQRKTATSKRLSYILSFTGIIDLLAILPSILPLLLGGVDLRWLRILRLMRLLKFSHYSSALEDLFSAVRHEWRSFVATLYLLILAIFLSSSLIYVFEQSVQPEHFGSIPDAMWWTVVTLTTVGYGDIVPITVAGKLVATLTALMGVCVVALLTGIVATGFTNQVSMRRNQLEAEITSALSDGMISGAERKRIEDLRQRLNISEQDALVIMSYLSREVRATQRGKEDS